MKGAAGGRTVGGRLTRSRAVRWGAGGTAATAATPPTRSRVASAGSAAAAATASAAKWGDGRLPATTVRTTS